MHGTIIFNPGTGYQTARRLWQGCPTVLRTPGGKLFAGWYSGGSREPSAFNYNLLVSSCDGGLSWSEPLLVIESLTKEKVLAIDIELWLDPRGRMWLFWTQRHLQYAAKDPRHLQCWAIVCDDPDAPVLRWSEPRCLAPGFLRCQPTVLSDGRWLLCAYDWTGTRYHYSESSDCGETWIRREAGEKTVPVDFDETMVLERLDGSLWMLSRNAHTGFLSETVSRDGGATWLPGRQTSIPNPASRFYLRRLKSGRVLLINNDDSGKRINMTAFLSEDDGVSWKYSLVIDPRETSYPDAVEAEDGTIYMVHDRGRMSFKEILCSRFTEADIMAGKLTDHDSYVCQIISKAPRDPWNTEEAERMAKLDREMFDVYF
ncbi:MAG: sialidase family protein [Victivallales bacterium]